MRSVEQRRVGPWIAACLLACACGALAQDLEPSSVTLAVTGVSGPELRAKRRRFVAVNVVLENRGATAADGVLRGYQAIAKDDPRPYHNLYYERRVPLPAGARRRETLYYYCQEDEPEDRLCVSYEPDAGVAPPPVFPRLVFADEALHVLAVSSHDMAAARELRAAPCFVGAEVREVVLSQGVPELLPRHPLGYASVDAVVVADLDPEALDPEQVRALEDWVSSGGALVFLSTGRAGEREASPLHELYPVIGLSGQPLAQRSLQPLERLVPRQIPLPERIGGASEPLSLEPVPVERVRARTGAEVIAGDDGAPLIVRQRVGTGTIQFVAFSLAGRTFSAWGGRGRLIGHLLPGPRDVALPTEEPRAAPPLEELVRNLSEAVEHLSPPSVFLIAPLLLAYVVLVGPGVFVALSQRKLLRYGLPVGVGVSCAFALAFFGLSWAHKSDEAVTTRIGAIELASTPGAPSRVDLMAGIFSTSSELLEGTAPPESLLAPIALQHASTREARVNQDPASPSLSGVTIATWSLRRFRLERLQQLGHLEADLTWERGQVRGTLTNASDLTLPGLTLLTEHGWLDLPRELPPGASLEVEGALKDYSEGQVSRLLVREVVGKERQYTLHYGKSSLDGFNGSVPRRVEAMFRAELQTQLVSPLGLRGLLVTWVDEAPAGIDFGDGDPRILARSVVRCPVELRFAGGPHRLQHWRPQVVDYANWFAHSEGIGSAPILEQPEGRSTSFVDFAWQLSPTAARGVQLQADARLRWRTVDVPYEPQVVFLSAWDPGRGTWVRLADMKQVLRQPSGEFVWPEPGTLNTLAPFFDPASGQLLVRLTSNGDAVVLPQLELEGTLVVDPE